MKFSTSFKIIFGFLLILLIGIISSVYDIDINFFLSKVNNKIENNSTASKDIEVKLASCVDGDTAKFILNGKKEYYRFLGINTEEKNTKYGKEASNYTCNKLSNASKITIKYENSSNHKDKYGRNLVWVYVDGDFLQENLLKNGLAQVKYIYTKLTYLDRLYTAAEVAKNKKLKLYRNYKNIKYDEKYTVVFKYGEWKKEVTSKNGKIILPNNPVRKNYVFNGWMLNGNFYDLSKPITNNLVLEASFTKNT